MIPEVYWINSIEKVRLAIMPRPRAGEWLFDEIAGWKASGVDVVVSLLENEERRELELEQEENLCFEVGIEFIHFPIIDREVPTSEREVHSLIARIQSKLNEGKGVGIHCRAGIGRSGLVAGCVLGSYGIPADDIFPQISQARGVSVPDTQEQKDWTILFIKHARESHS